MKKILPSDYNFDTVHIIGNGPSAEKFNSNRNSGLVISIHVPTVTSDIVFSQRPVFWGNYGIPIACRENLYLADSSGFCKTIWSDKENVSKINKHFAIKDWMIYHLEDKEFHNSGHACYLWAMHQNPLKVHLWGFDSIFSQTYDYKPSYQEHHTNRLESKVSRRSFINDPIRISQWKDLWTRILQPNTEVHQ